jgi:glycosyltransferase involved in cell wall biosynthesis
VHLCLITSSYPTAPDDLALPFLPQFADALAAHGHRVTVLAPDRRLPRLPARGGSGGSAASRPEARGRGERPLGSGGTSAALPDPDEGQGDGPFPRSDRSVRVLWFPWLGGRRPVVTLNRARPRDLLTAAHLHAAAYATAAALDGRDRIDHVLALFALPAGAVALALAATHGRPYSVWALGSDVLVLGRRQPFRAAIRTILRRADRRFADGRALRDEVAELAGRDCLFLPSARELPPPAAAPLDPTRRGLLFLGRLEPVKGVDVLLDAFARLAPDHPDLDLHLVGDGSLAPLARAAAPGRVHLHAPVGPSGVAGFLAAADALVLPSRSESIPTTLLEAAAAGLPAIASSVGDVPRLVAEYALGQTVPPADPAALESALRCWATAAPARLPPDAVARVRAAFRPAAAADLFLSAIAPGP